CILYSSCVCFGTIGRQLMIVPEEWYNKIDQNKNYEIDAASKPSKQATSGQIIIPQQTASK
ncbi:14047_t:CDS:2, partial [Dentiscutata erythropus]